MLDPRIVALYSVRIIFAGCMQGPVPEFCSSACVYWHACLGHLSCSFELSLLLGGWNFALLLRGPPWPF